MCIGPFYLFWRVQGFRKPVVPLIMARFLSWNWIDFELTVFYIEILYLEFGLLIEFRSY